MHFVIVYFFVRLLSDLNRSIDVALVFFILALAKKCEAELQETVMRREEEMRLCSEEQFKLVNSVSLYKEYMGAKMARMKSELVETADAVANTYKGYGPSLPLVPPSHH